MKYIKPYQIFESSSAAALTPVQISWLNKCTKGSWKLNSSTGLIDIKGHFNCNSQSLKELNGVKFWKVSGDFYCSGNQLTTLEGAPQTVGGDFFCHGNQLTTLEGAPQSVGGDFYCHGNRLTSLEGAPQSVGRSFDCGGNQLTTLVGAPRSVGRSFDCSGNQLTTLVGAPQSVGVHFFCKGNPVSEETLESIFSLMRKGKSYQQALEEYLVKIPDEDKVLMYKQMPSLSPEETRKYQALAKYISIKSYL
jgi:hypothetical protein